jgi:8-oxo-dGTP diphosphatase
VNSAVVLAAGGVLWRPATAGETDGDVEVALVHRPRYDDWSLPKGKLTPGEHPLAAALREVVEETGHDAVPGRPLTTQHYLAAGAPKTVHYWAMEARGGRFVPHSEVDALRWLRLPEARRALTYDRDGDVLDAFAAGPARTAAIVVVRHARAGRRADWAGDDRLRPLDAQGQEQAQALAPLLAAYHPVRLIAADVLRCTATVDPLARRVGLAVETVPELTEDGYARAPAPARELVERLVADGEPAVVCTQGGVIPDLLDRLVTSHPPLPTQREIRDDPGLPKGGFWVLHTLPGRIVAVEKHRM